METIKRKCKVIMLPTEKRSNIIKETYHESYIKYHPSGIDVDLTPYESYQHLYITESNNIKKDDWYIVNNLRLTNIIRKAQEDKLKFNCGLTKIIASTDESLNLPKPSKSFIKKYCEERGIDQILVHYHKGIYHKKTNEEIIYFGFETEEDEVNWEERIDLIVKNNEITISKIKDSYTREEVVSLILKVNHDFNPDNSSYYSENIRVKSELLNNWINENL